MSLRRKPKCTALVKPKGKSGGNVGRLLQQSCLPGSRHRHPLLLYETWLKHSFSAEILLFSIPAEVVPLSANVIALAALPKASPPPRWPPTTSGEASSVVFTPRESLGHGGDSDAAGQTHSPDTTEEPQLLRVWKTQP